MVRSLPRPISRLCSLVGLHRSRLYYAPRERQQVTNENEKDLLVELAGLYPSFGYRRITVMARKRLGHPINRKKVLRILKLNKLALVPPRRRTDKPEGRKIDQTAPLPNQKWQADMTKIWCGIDGWGYLVNIIDCCTRELVGHHFDLRCSTDETLAALHIAVSSRFNGERPLGLTLRTDNGPQLTSRRFEKALRCLSIAHETTHFNCPDENAIVESFHASLKRDCVYLHDFESFEHARLVLDKYFENYNNIFPHGSLRMMAPAEYAKTLTNNQAKSVLI